MVHILPCIAPWVWPVRVHSQTEPRDSASPNSPQSCEDTECCKRSLRHRYLLAINAQARTVADPPPLPQRKINNLRHGYRLSITHKLNSNHNAKLDIDEPGQSSPDHGIAGWRIAVPSQVASQLGKFCDVTCIAHWRRTDRPPWCWPSLGKPKESLLRFPPPSPPVMFASAWLIADR